MELDILRDLRPWRTAWVQNEGTLTIGLTPGSVPADST